MSARVIFLFLAVFLLPQMVFAPFVSPAYAQEHKTGGDGEESHPEFEYVELNPLVLPIITDKGLTQQVSLMISLEVKYGHKEEVETYKPRLADAYLQDLYGALGTGLSMMKGEIIDVVSLKARLTAVTGKVVEGDIVHSVLLQVVQQRPM